MRFSYKRSRTFRLNTNIYVPVDAWSETKGKLVIPRSHTKTQIMLQELQAKVDALSNHLEAEAIKAPSDADGTYWAGVVLAFHGIKPKDSTIAEVAAPSAAVDELFGQFIELLYKNEKSKRQMETSWNVLKRFARYKKMDIALEDWDDVLLEELEEFLRIEYTFFNEKGECMRKWKYLYECKSELRAKRRRGENKIFSVMKKIRTFFNWCVLTERLEKSPFAKHKLKHPVYGTPYYMTKDKLTKLYEFDFASRPKLAIQRDIFVLQSTLGMRVGDFYSLTRANIVGNAIEYSHLKHLMTRVEWLESPLTARAKEIIERYHKSEGQIGLMPFISEQKYNKAIKEMLRIAGINRVVTVLNPTTRLEEQRPINEVASSHMARRYFIGNLYAKVQDPALISSMTGHSPGSRAFERYRAIHDEIKIPILKIFD